MANLDLVFSQVQVPHQSGAGVLWPITLGFGCFFQIGSVSRMMFSIHLGSDENHLRPMICEGFVQRECAWQGLYESP